MSIHYTPLNSAVERMAHLAQWTLKKARSGQLVLIFCEEKERRLAAEWIAYQLKEQFEGLKKLAIEVIHPYDKNDQLLKIFDKRKKYPKILGILLFLKRKKINQKPNFIRQTTISLPLLFHQRHGQNTY